MNSLTLSRSIFETLIAYAKREVPLEACGILSGQRGRVEAFHPMMNADQSPEHFTMDPKEQFAVARAIRSSGQRMLAIFHSHPASPARPSEEDIRLAVTPDVTYVILSLLNQHEPALKGFWIDESGVAEVPVVVAANPQPVGTELDEPLLRLPEAVVADVAEYRRRTGEHLRGGTSPIAFRAFRVPMGIYEQRQSGRYMLRVRLGAGLVLPFQIRQLAELSRTYGNGVLHVTTRQDIQIHEVGLAETVLLQEKLLEVGLSSRGGGGNTVRNITACPRASVCPKAVFDVAPHAIALAEHLLQDRGSFNLPRKFKVAFSGCSEDCAFASANDLGFFAHSRDGRRGFAVYAGGGLGNKPRTGVRIEEFVESERVFEVGEAVRGLFEKLGDRMDKRHARLRHLLERLGVEAFVRAYREQLGALRAGGDRPPTPVIRSLAGYFGDMPLSPPLPSVDLRLPLGVLQDRQLGHFTVEVRLGHGQIPADDLDRVADLAERFGAGVVAASQDQNLLLPGVVECRVSEVRAAVESLGHGIARSGPKIVACAGASTCKLGLCHSPALADAIGARFAQADDQPVTGPTSLRISGCPNSCGNHLMAELGFEGTAKRHQGKLLPCYQVVAGGDLAEGKARLGTRLGLLPARSVPDFVAAVYEQEPKDLDALRELVKSHSEILSHVPDEYFVDFGSTEPFSLKGRGPGECGAGVLEVVRADLEEAKAAVSTLSLAPTTAERSASVYGALLASARALLPIFGLEAKKDREIIKLFTERLIDSGWVKPEARKLLEAALDWRLGDLDSLDGWTEETKALTERVDELFRSLDGQLQFRAERISPEKPAQATDEPNPTEVDLRGVACPMNFVKAKIALERLPVGQLLEVLLDDGEPTRNVPASMADQGQEVVRVSPDRAHSRVLVRRKR